MSWKPLFVILPLTLCVAFSLSCAGAKSAQRPQDRPVAPEMSVETRLGESEARIEVLEKRLNALERRVTVRSPEEKKIIDVRELTKEVAFFITPKKEGEQYVPPAVQGPAWPPGRPPGS